MAKHQGKSSNRNRREERPGQPNDDRRRERHFARGGSFGDRRPAAPAPGEEALLAALATFTTGATAGQVAEAMRGDNRATSMGLRKLVAQGRILEDRPGRYRVSGAGGEFSAQLVEEPAGFFAKLADGVLKPINPRYRLGARPGDIIQIVEGEDGAAVTRILRRSGRETVGTMYFSPGGPQLICDNRREGTLPVTKLFTGFDDNYKAGDRVVGLLNVDERGETSVEVTRILGKASPEVTDFTYVKLVHDLPGDFPPEVEAEAKAFTKRFAKAKREDLREDLVFTIDPVTAKDFDDAISINKDRKGRWVLGVHIADVSHFVKEGTELDTEAVNRGTSIYLVNRVIPMLPEALSNGLCSLVPNEPRYTLSAFLTLDKEYKLVEVRMAETIIESRHRMSYEEAMAVLEDKDEKGKWPDDLRANLKQVHVIAQKLRSARVAAGAVNLFSVEHRFKLDVDGNPIATEVESSDASHQLIEECMLLANRAVARWLADQGLPCSYRLHESPDEERLKQFAMVLESYGKESTGLSNRFQLQRILADLAKEPPAARLVLNLMLLRCFKKAVYGVDNVGHYALAFDHYCHFTSPIRRYPDLIAHRLVKKGLKLAAYKGTEVRREYLDALCKQASWLEQRAEVAERDLHARKSCRYLATRIGEEFAGVVSTPNGGGLSVQMLETGFEGFLPIRELSDDRYEFDPERLALVGRHSGRVITVGEELDVLISNVDIDRGDVTLALVQGRKVGAAPRAGDRNSPRTPEDRPRGRTEDRSRGRPDDRSRGRSEDRSRGQSGGFANPRPPLTERPALPTPAPAPAPVRAVVPAPAPASALVRNPSVPAARPTAAPAASEGKKADTKRLPRKLLNRWAEEDTKSSAPTKPKGKDKRQARDLKSRRKPKK